MATNGDMPSDEESLPGSPSFEANGHDDDIEEIGEEPLTQPKSALKESSRLEPSPQHIKPELPEQPDPNSINLSELTPLSPEIIARQATINIGTIGHVAHGKSTVVKAISGVQTVRFKNELERNITIKLGYANAKIYRCDNEDCPRPGCYKSFKSEKEVDPPCDRDGCTGRYRLLRHVSFVDCFDPCTKVLMADLTARTVGELEVGDALMGPDGAVRRVQSTTEGIKELYRIVYGSPEDNSFGTEEFTCTGGHLLVLRIDMPVDKPVFHTARGQYFMRVIKGNADGLSSRKFFFDDEYLAQAFYESQNNAAVVTEMTVETYLNCPASLKEKARLFYNGKLSFDGMNHTDLSLPGLTAEDSAWLLGVWLGDGDASDAKFTFGFDDVGVIARCKALANKMGLVGVLQPYSDRNAYWFRLSTTSDGTNRNADNPFYQLLVKLQLLRAKKVDHQLIMQPLSVRRALVAGLVDSEGYCDEGQFGSCQSVKCHASIALGLDKLLRSMGWRSHVSQCAVRLHGKVHQQYRVNFNGPRSLPGVDSAKQGATIVRNWSTSQPFSVTKVGVGEYKGFETDGDGRFLLADFIVAHNCPGHDILMSTMLSGAAVMDAALLLIAGNEICPQPQTSEHLAAIEIMKLNHIIILQNKVDLMREEGAKQHYDSILKFIRGTVADGSPIIPISAQLKYNIDAINEYLVTRIPVPVRDFGAAPHMIIIRSFDVNKPGAEIEDLKGGVAGGSILTGVLKLGDEIEIRPGLVQKDDKGQIRCRPIFSHVVSLLAEQNDLKFAVPGGLIGVGTKVDPTLCRADRLIGFVLGLKGRLPAIYTELEVNYFLLRRLLGVKSEDGKQAKVAKLTKTEVLMVNIGSTATGAKVMGVKADAAKLSLTSPACTEIGEKIALSRRIEKHWRLIGWANIVAGNTLEPTTD